jgi:hypothetical protein
MWNGHVGYVVLHRKQEWFCLAINDDLFFTVSHSDCNTSLSLLNPSLQIIRTSSPRGTPFSKAIIITSALRILQRRIKKRLRSNHGFKGIISREINARFPIKNNKK